MRQEPKRRARMTSINALFTPLFKQSAGRAGPLVLDLIRHWPDIVGADLAKTTRPISIRFSGRRTRSEGTLYLMVLAEAALFIQHDTARILDSANRFLGYRAFTRISLKQGSLEDLRDNAPPKNPTLQPPTPLEPAANIEDPDLAAALARLKAQVMARR